MKELFPTQIKLFYETLLQNYISPKDFEVSKDATSIKHKHSEFAFIIRENDVEIEICPGVEKYKEVYTASRKYGLTKILQIWLGQLIKEIQALNYCSQIDDLPKFNFDRNVKDEYFTENEKAQTRTRINGIKDEIRKLDVDKNILEGIENKLDETLTLLDKLSKRQWLDYFYGAAASYIFNLTLDPDSIKKIWSIIEFFFSEWSPLKQ